MREYLHGWFAKYDLKDQCGDCSEVVTEGRMVCWPSVISVRAQLSAI